jgi:signal peptidase I
MEFDLAHVPGDRFSSPPSADVLPMPAMTEPWVEVLAPAAPARSRAHRRRGKRRRGNRRRVLVIFELLLAAALIMALWPTSLGGRISYSEVSGHSMLPTYQPGDLVIAVAVPSYSAGDPVVYRVPKGEVGGGLHVIHRIVAGNGSTGFTMKGDHNEFVDPWKPRRGDIVGRVMLRLPRLGGWLAWLARPVNVGILCASITVTCMLWPRSARKAPRHRSRPRQRTA